MINLLLLLHLLLFSLNLQNAHSTHCTTITSTKTFEKCMTLPTQQASIAWTFHPHNSTLDLAFFGSFISPSGWVAWGLNPSSPEMTGTRALLAFPDPNSGKLLLLPFLLDSSVKLQKSPLLSRPLDDNDHDNNPYKIITSSAALYGGNMATVHNGASVQIFATLKLPNPNNNNKSTKIHHVWNRGLYVQGYSPTIHPTASTDLSSFATIDHRAGAGTISGAGATSGGSLKTVHAVFNAVSWGLILPAGVVVARYLRHFSTLGPAWFYAHAGLQLAGFFLGATGFAVGLRLGELSGRGGGIHRRLGFAAVMLAAVQAMALMFRPRATERLRKYWKSYHHLVGYACVVVGVVNVFQGFEVMGEGGSYAKLAYCMGLSTIIGACVALEVNAWVVFCRRSKEEKMRREGLIGNVVNGGSEKGNSGIILD